MPGSFLLIIENVETFAPVRLPTGNHSNTHALFVLWLQEMLKDLLIAVDPLALKPKQETLCI